MCEIISLYNIAEVAAAVYASHTVAAAVCDQKNEHHHHLVETSFQLKQFLCQCPLLNVIVVGVIERGGGVTGANGLSPGVGNTRVTRQVVQVKVLHETVLIAR